MSTLILVSFGDEPPARQAFSKIQELHQMSLMRLAGAALVDIAKDGHLLMETTPHDPVTPLDMTQAAGFAMLLGSILSTPQFGFAVSGTIGAVFEKHEQRDDSVDQKFRDQVSQAMRPGHWAIVIYASEVANDEVSRQLEPFGGEQFTVNLDSDDEAELAREVGVS
jgi:uncharacterized membrane protein